MFFFGVLAADRVSAVTKGTAIGDVWPLSGRPGQLWMWVRAHRVRASSLHFGGNGIPWWLMSWALTPLPKCD